MFRRKSNGENGTETPNLLGTLLLVVDGSEPSIVAANFAVHLASQIGSTITAVYVVDTATMDYLLQMHIFVSDERQEFERDVENTGKRYLEYVRTIGNNNGIEITTKLLNGSFHQTILAMARNQKVDAIILGGWRRSITRKDATSVERQLILDEAECPVIVIKGEVHG